MAISSSKLNLFLFYKLPAAFWCGVRVKSISQATCATTVKYKWINQNPFQSMYFAVQAMAAELSTGALCVSQIKQSGKNISMLVANNKASFTKKAIGRIYFTCNDGEKITQAIQQTILTGESQTVWMQSIGVNQKGEQVSVFDFEWTLKLKPKQKLNLFKLVFLLKIHILYL
jgi:hypothetical protein